MDNDLEGAQSSDQRDIERARIGWFASTRGWWLDEDYFESSLFGSARTAIRDSYVGQVDGLPTVFLLSTDEATVSGVGRGRPAGRSDSFRRRLEFDEWEPLPPFQIHTATSGLPHQSRGSIDTIKQRGIGNFTLITSQHILAWLSEVMPESSRVVEGLLATNRRTAWLDDAQSSSAAIYREQLDGVKIGLDIAGIDRKHALAQLEHPDQPANLQLASVHEDHILANDMQHFSGWDSLPYLVSGTQFVERHGARRLQVFLANRVSIEQQTGADIVHYVRDYHAFVLVQYKRCHKENGSWVYRPDAKFSEQRRKLRRIQSFWSGSTYDVKRDHRLGQAFCLFKFCPSHQPLIPDMSRGKYFDLVGLEASIDLGPKGGRVLRYDDVDRYYTNTLFCDLVSQGWIGSIGNATEQIFQVIEESLDQDRSVLLAEVDLGGRRGRSGPGSRAVTVRGFGF